MTTTYLPDNEADRLEALQQYEILDTAPETEFDSITRLASYICGTPICLVSLVDANRIWFKSRVGIEAPELPRDGAFCTHAIQQHDIFVVPDALQDERFSKLPIIAMTAFAMKEDETRCLSAGMTDYISKPIHPHELYSTLAKYNRKQ